MLLNRFRYGIHEQLLMAKAIGALPDIAYRIEKIAGRLILKVLSDFFILRYAKA
jgi:hypothetical protein